MFIHLNKFGQITILQICVIKMVLVNVTYFPFPIKIYTTNLLRKKR